MRRPNHLNNEIKDDQYVYIVEKCILRSPLNNEAPQNIELKKEKTSNEIQHWIQDSKVI